MAGKTLVEQDFVDAAALLECEVAAVKAVCEVESPRGGFNPDGSPTSLFEGHQFYRYTKGRFAQSHPNLCYPSWDRTQYGKDWQVEKDRLNRAIALDRTAALMSASFGRFQVMGFNFSLVGFTNVEAFYQAMQVSEGEHLKAFCEYVIHSGLKDEIQRKDWAGFARGYNGPGYQKNQYDLKLAKAYAKYLVLQP
jgi:hypothetical protein